MKRIAVFPALMVVAALSVPVAAQAKPPKKCAALVTTTEELSEVLDEFFAVEDEFFAVPEGDPSEEALLTELDELDVELRSMSRLLKRDLKKCKK